MNNYTLKQRQPWSFGIKEVFLSCEGLIMVDCSCGVTNTREVDMGQ